MQRVSALLTRKGFDLAAEPVVQCADTLHALKVSFTGLCGSDLHVYTSRTHLPAPLFLGHEFVGSTIEQPDNPATSGRSLIVNPSLGCGLCRMCLSGYDHLCYQGCFLGSQNSAGSLKGIIYTSPETITPLPPDIPAYLGVLVEPLGNAFSLVSLINSTALNCLIIGGGPLGTLIATVVKEVCNCSSVLISERSDWRREFLKDKGFLVCHPSELSHYSSFFGERGAEIVIEAADASTSSMLDAVSNVAPRGTIIIFGINSNSNMSIPAKQCRGKLVTLQFLRRCSSNDFSRGFRFLCQHWRLLSTFVTNIYNIRDIDMAFRRAANSKRDYMKMVIDHHN